MQHRYDFTKMVIEANDQNFLMCNSIYGQETLSKRTLQSGQINNSKEMN